MPKNVNYPRKSFETALNVADNVEKLGGKCTEQTLADKLGKKLGGSFNSDVGASIKHGLITKDKQNLKITDLFSNIHLSYTEQEKTNNLIKAFLLPDTYREILERFDGKELPIDVLDKILIREYNVVNTISKLVANNLIKGSENLNLIQQGIVRLNDSSEIINEIEKKLESEEERILENKEVKKNMTDSVVEKIKNEIKPDNNIQKEIVININIQLSVPETTNEEVYEKFFSAMKKNLLS